MDPALELRTEEGAIEFASTTKESREARHVSGVSMNGGLEKPLCEAVKLKPVLPWRTQEV